MIYFLPIYFIFIINGFLFAQNNNPSDTVGVHADLLKCQELIKTDASSSMELSYKWETLLTYTTFYNLYAQFALLHGQNVLIMTSPEASIEVFSRTIEVLKDKKINPYLMAELHARLGFVLNVNGESNEALKHLLEASNIYESLHDLVKLNWCKAYIGGCYVQQNDIEKAELVISESITTLQNYGAGYELLEAYRSYGNLVIPEESVLNIFHKYKIRMYMELMKNLAKEEGYKIHLGFMYKTLGDLEFYDQNLKEANEMYNLSIQLFENFNLYKLETQLNLGKSNYRQGKVEEALKILIPLSEFAAQNGWIVLLHQAYSTIALIYYTLKDYKKGASYAGKSFTFWRIISNNKRKLEMDALIAENELQKQKIQTSLKNVALENANFEKKVYLILIILSAIILSIFIYFYWLLSQKNKKLNLLNKENYFLLGEANHRIKNNLQLILSIIAHENYKQFENNEIDNLKNIYTKIESIAALHQQFYLNDDKKTIALDEYLNEVYKNLVSFLDSKQIILDFKIEKHDFEINKAVYLGLYVNELIINAIKHAFNNDQKFKNIKIEVYSKDSELYIDYEDNGIGIMQNKPEMILLLSKQMKSEIKLITENGTKIKLKFKE